MKKSLLLLLIVVLAIFSVNFVVAQPTGGGGGTGGTGGTSGENIRILMDFNVYETLLTDAAYGETYVADDTLRDKRLSELADDEVDENGIPLYQIQQSDMLLDKWQVLLNSSANTVENRRNSYTSPIKTKGGDTVLGARIHFPTDSYNSWAKIAPPFPFVSYDTNGKILDPGYKDDVTVDTEGATIGVIKNVGQIEWVQVKVSGRNFKHSLSIVLEDSTGNTKEYFLGYLDFLGWRKLRWSNPNYIDEIKYTDIFKMPLYPREIPLLKFNSFVVFRYGTQLGGDYVIYFSSVSVKFDRALSKEEMEQVDIDDEYFWEILKDKSEEKKDIQRRKYVEKIDLLKQELLRRTGSPDPATTEERDKYDNYNSTGGGGGTTP